MKKWIWAGLFVAGIAVLPGKAQSTTYNSSSDSKVWLGDVGSGFAAGMQSVSVELGASVGEPIFGGSGHHDLALASVTYGREIGHFVAENHWYRGNWELRLELFGGSQFSPQPDWVVGLAPHLRYDFALGLPIVPFIDGGAGASGTEIGPPDLSRGFDFNLQATTGFYWFMKKDVALTIEARYLHLSCAGLTTPNLGLNTFLGLAGMTFFF